MASCLRGRVPPAPAGVPRWTELSLPSLCVPIGARPAASMPWAAAGSGRPAPPTAVLLTAPLTTPVTPALPVLLAAVPATAVLAALPPRCRSSIAAMSWPLRIRPVPVMPSDCAIRCSSGSSFAAIPAPAPARPPAPALAWPASPSGEERTAPDCWGEVPGEPAAPGAAPPGGDRTGDSSPAPEEPENRSMVSLTRGPSQGAGVGGVGCRWFPAVACHPLWSAGYCCRARPVVVLAAIPALRRLWLASAYVTRRPGPDPGPGRRESLAAGGCLERPPTAADRSVGRAGSGQAPLPLAGHLVQHPA
jgi:hypothetical protein